METAFSYMESFIKSEAGRRFTSVVPRLVAAKDLEKMLEVKTTLDNRPHLKKTFSLVTIGCVTGDRTEKMFDCSFPFKF